MKTLILLLFPLFLFSQVEITYNKDLGVIKIKSDKPIFEVNLDTTNEKVKPFTTYSNQNKTVKYKGVKTVHVTTENIDLKDKLILNIGLYLKQKQITIKNI